eukprot:266733_1
MQLDDIDVFSHERIPMKDLLESIYPPKRVLTFGYIRENAFSKNQPNFPMSIMNYIILYAFYTGQFEYKSDFDINGIVYAIATDYGQTQWTNPAKRNLIRITSTRWSGYIENVLSVTKVEGECCSCGTMNPRLTIDFGAKRKIKPSHYTLRHDDSAGYYLRKWNFEGSNDGASWNTLRSHCDDTSLNAPYATHTWTIDADEYYQMFRIFLTGGWAILSCSGFEIYGYLTHESSVSDTYVVGFTAMPHLKGDLLNESNL